MPENQNFIIIQHGVRLSGMPAWNPTLSEQEIWQVTTFLSHMDKLPPQVSDEWKTAAATTQSTNTDASQPASTEKKGMSMPMH
jgi:mono/diheme cytochrome c family protein